MYYGQTTFFKITHLFSSHISPRIGFLALKWRRHQGVRSPPNPLSDRRKSLPDDPDIAPHGLRYAHLASPWLAELYKSFPGRPISNLIDFGRELCLFGGHVASRWISERVIHKCIIQNHYSLFFHRRAQTAPKSLFR